MLQLPTLDLNRKILIAVIGIVIIVTIVLCWQMWKPEQPVPETYKPPVTLSDGSQQLERKPDPDAKPAAAIPKGSKLIRKVTVTVQAKNPIQTVSGTVTVETVQETKSMKAMSPAPVAVAENPCPPVTVDLSVVENEDETTSVIASSPDGTILGGVDVPVKNAAPIAEQPKWAAGIVGDPVRQLGGVFLDRDLGPFRLGAQVNQRDEGHIPDQFWLKVGIRF